MPKTCTNCQTVADDAAVACPVCGAAFAAAPQQAAPAQGYDPNAAQQQAYQQPYQQPQAQPGYGAPAAQPSPGSSMPPMNFNINRLSNNDKITAIASFVLLIALFLPWFSYNTGFGVVTGSGETVHGYLWVVFILCLAVVVYMGARAAWDKLPINVNIPHTPVILGVTLVNFLLVLIAFLTKPGFSGVGWTWGAFVALAAAVIAAAPTAVPFFKNLKASSTGGAAPPPQA